MIRLRNLSAWTGAIVALGLSAGQAHADFLVQVATTAVQPPPPGIVTSGLSTTTVTSFGDQPSDLTLASGAPSNATSQAFGQTSVATARSATDNTQDSFTIPINFTLVLSGSGNPSGDTGTTATIHVIGTLSGAVGFGFDSLSFSVTGGDLAAPTGSPASTNYKFVNVDGVTVGVGLTAYTPPGSPPGTTQDFAVYLYAPTVPEPSTVALLGVGGLLIAAPKLRRRVRRLASSN